MLLESVFNLVIATAIIAGGGWCFVAITAWFDRNSERVAIGYGKRLGLLLGALMLAIALAVALDQLGLAGTLLRQLVIVFMGAILLAAALAVGLGTRDVAAGLVAGHLVRRRFRAGDHVEVAGLKGRVRQVGSVATVIETEDADGLTHRHSVPNRCMLNEAVQ